MRLVRQAMLEVMNWKCTLKLREIGVRLYIGELWHRFERMSKVMMDVQDSLERLVTDLMRDREERLRDRRISKEKGTNIGET